jgi:tetratricopeptide (TPR) repeat protein
MKKCHLAIAAYSASIETDDKFNFDTMIGLIDGHILLESYENAFKYAQIILANTPYDKRVLFRLSYIYLMIKNPEEANATIQQLLAKDPENKLGFCILGAILLEQSVSDEVSYLGLLDESKMNLRHCLHSPYHSLVRKLLAIIDEKEILIQKPSVPLGGFEIITDNCIAKCVYPYSSLKATSGVFPPDVDLTCREEYLSDYEFQVLSTLFKS